MNWTVNPNPRAATLKSVFLLLGLLLSGSLMADPGSPWLAFEGRGGPGGPSGR